MMHMIRARVPGRYVFHADEEIGGCGSHWVSSEGKSYLDGIAIPKYNEATDEIELYDKKNPDIRLYTNDTKTTYLKPADKLKEYYTELGIWNEDNRNINPKDAMEKAKQTQYNPVPLKDGKPTDPIQAKNDAMLAYVPKV